MISKRVQAFILAFSFIAALEAGCKNKQVPPKETDTPISGQINIVADESFSPLIKNEISTFTQIYKETNINVQFLPEANVVSTFFASEKNRLMIIPRRLHDDEKKYFTQLGLPPHEIKIAIDAVAFIINTQNPDSNLRYDQVIDILNGKISSWDQINKTSTLGKLMLVFDNQRSSTLQYIRENVLKETPLTTNAFAVDSNAAVIDYIEKNTSAIGVIGVSWIIDRNDSTSDNFVSRIKVVAVSSPDSVNSFYLPSKRFIYSIKYPFLRELFIISQEKRDGLGTGFANYVASDEGQRIVQRFGLLPIDNAVRIIELKNQF